MSLQLAGAVALRHTVLGPPCFSEAREQPFSLGFSDELPAPTDHKLVRTRGSLVVLETSACGLGGTPSDSGWDPSLASRPQTLASHGRCGGRKEPHCWGSGPL